MQVRNFLLLFFIALFLTCCNQQEQKQPETKNKKHSLLPVTVRAVKPGRYIEVTHSDELNPQPGKDFILFFWVKLKELPEPGQRVVLVSKYDGLPPSVTGWAVGLLNEGGSYHPTVFWNDSTSKSKWKVFPEITLIPDTWNLYVLSFEGETSLALRRVMEIREMLQEVEVLGGYNVGPVKGKFSQGSLLFGASPNRDLKGLTGPLMIISKRHLAKEIDTVIEEYLQNLSAPPSGVPFESVRLWVDEELNDKSKFKHEIKRHFNEKDNRRKKTGKGGGEDIDGEES